MMTLYLVSFLDRVNVGFAALTMNRDLGFSPTVFGWGAGIFFFGYVLFEVPSNVLLERFGARRWICRIMVSWGLVSGAMALVQGPWSFYTLRFLLGVAEAGFFPGMILYLTYWYPAARRARIVAIFMAAVPLASVLGAPLSGLILSAGDGLGLKGWQWLFVIEGVPACLLGLSVLALLPDGPARAKWLTDHERARITEILAADAAANPHAVRHRLSAALADGRVWLLGLIYLGLAIGLYGIGLWLPQIVKGMGFSVLATGFIVAAPYAVSAATMNLWGRRSDRRNERIGHVALPAALGAAALMVGILVPSNPAVLCALGLGTVCLYAMAGPFWAIPPAFLGGTAAAGGIALVNSIGNLGGFVGPYLMGWLKQDTGDYRSGLAALAVSLAASAVLTLVLGRRLRRRAAEVKPAAAA
jgi:ACS family tartrate transporter-like MFS transporter